MLRVAYVVFNLACDYLSLCQVIFFEAKAANAVVKNHRHCVFFRLSSKKHKPSPTSFAKAMLVIISSMNKIFFFMLATSFRGGLRFSAGEEPITRLKQQLHTYIVPNFHKKVNFM